MAFRHEPVLIQCLFLDYLSSQEEEDRIRLGKELVTLVGLLRLAWGESPQTHSIFPEGFLRWGVIQA